MTGSLVSYQMQQRQSLRAASVVAVLYRSGLTAPNPYLLSVVVRTQRIYMLNLHLYEDKTDLYDIFYIFADSPVMLREYLRVVRRYILINPISNETFFLSFVIDSCGCIRFLYTGTGSGRFYSG